LFLILLFFIALFAFGAVTLLSVHAQAGGVNLSSVSTFERNGKSIDDYIINGPPHPPAGYEVRHASVLPVPGEFSTFHALTVPAYDWVFGCSSVSGAMIAGYYDRNGYPNMYTGPTDGGVAPLDNSIWGTWSDGVDTYPNIPLAASHQGVDGRATKGSIDDYWVQYGSTASDPYITGVWTQHAWTDAIGDYMKTSQSAFGNSDGSTHFYTWNSDPGQLTCADMVSNTIDTLDGTYGRKLFYEARGYTVTACYNQKTDNNSGGFTLAMYKAEIDAGRPVLLNLYTDGVGGHSIVGVGYDDASTTIKVHDTWNHVSHDMTWGGSYEGMLLRSVSIVNLQSVTPPAAHYIRLPLILRPAVPPATFGKIAPANGATGQQVSLNLSWGASTNATTYYYCYDTTSNTNCEGTWTSTTSNSAVISGLTPNTTYYWQVYAENTGGTVYADTGAWWSFATGAAPSGPTPGFWESTTGDEFYVNPARTQVLNFTIYVSSPCGDLEITRTSPVTISGNSFSFTGTFFASGTFDTPTSAHGQDGLSNFYVPGCGYLDGGPWNYTATWKNSNQPTAGSSNEGTTVTVTVLPTTSSKYHLVVIK